MKKCWLFLLVILLPLSLLSQDCTLLANRLIPFPLRIANGFSYPKFLEQKQIWQKKGNAILPADAPEIASAESFLAYVEATVSANGLSRLRLQQLLAAGPSRKQKKLLKSLRSLQNKPQRSNLYSFINDLYVLIYRPARPLWQRFFSIQDLIQVRIESEILFGQLEQAMVNLGIFPAQGGMYDQFLQWKNRNINLVDSALYLSLNIIKLSTFGTVGGVPQTHLTKGVEQTAEIGQFIRELGGFDQAYPLLLARYGRQAIIDRAFIDARISYNFYFVLMTAIFFYETYPQFHFFFATAFTSLEDLQNYQTLTFDGERIRQEQFASYLEGHFQFFSTYPSDEQRWQQWELLRLVPDQQIKGSM